MKKQPFAFMATLAVTILLVLVLPSNTIAAQQTPFPQPKALDRDVEFWKRVYTEVDTSQGFIHDDKNLAVVYETIQIPKNYSRKARQRYVKKVKQKYNKILKTLATGKRSGLNKSEKRVLALWPKGVSNNTLRGATKRIRFQLGQSNKFKAGLIRSGGWKPYILETLDRMGLPKEIAALPHVESSFNHKAYSKVGAAGMWQFMRSTGRRFMRVDHVVDERMDPFKATVAAARLLENNYAVTNSWPLAIIAYNHGAGGMRRAARKLGTTDIVSILRNYRSRTFKFASRNFYVAFLAAVEIDKNPSKYFGQLNFNAEVDYEFVKLPGYMSINNITKSLNIARNDLMETNPALRPSVWNGDKYVPKNYELRINKNHIKQGSITKTALNQLSSQTYYTKQKPDLYHRVRRGQTLSTIAARYGVKVSDIVALNNLRNKHSIRSGQSLRLPQRGQRSTSRPTQVAESRSPKIEPVSIPQSGIYRVRRGDTLQRIANKYGLHTNEILALNKLQNKNHIYPGQKLIIAETSSTLPAKTPDAETTIYRVRRGDTLARIANKYRMSPNQLLSLNNIRNKNRIYPGQKLVVAKAPSSATELKSPGTSTVLTAISGDKFYKVRRGDTLERIAKKHGIKSQELLSLNNLRNKNRIYPGQKLLLAQAPAASQLTLDKSEDPFSPGGEKGDLPIAKVAHADTSLLDPAQTTANAITTNSNAETDVETEIGADSNNDAGQTADSPSERIVVADLQTQDVMESDALTTPATDERSTDSDNNNNDTPQDEASLDNPADSIGVDVSSDSESEIIADPSDYSVAKNHTIEVQAAETLGHYAEWLNLRASQLRRANRMRYGKPVVVGKRLKLDFSKVTHDQFEEQRIAYHRTLQEEFFEQFQIDGSERHKVRRGESIWKLAKRKYKIPIWLLRQYNPDLDFDRVQHGSYVTFPKVEERREGEPTSTVDDILDDPSQKSIKETIAVKTPGP